MLRVPPVGISARGDLGDLPSLLTLRRQKMISIFERTKNSWILSEDQWWNVHSFDTVRKGACSDLDYFHFISVSIFCQISLTAKVISYFAD